MQVNQPAETLDRSTGELRAEDVAWHERLFRRRWSERSAIRAAGLLLTAVSIPYAVASVSPLRLSGDEIVYLSMARAFATGVRYTGVTGFPVGYPWMLALLDRVGLGTASAFVVLNLVFLAAGLTAAYALFRRSFGFGRAASLLACGATLLVHDVIAVTAMPSSDAPFFGISMVCVFLLASSARLSGKRAAVAITAAGLLAAAAFEVRTIGVALAPTFAFACLKRADLRLALHRMFDRRPLATASGVFGLLAVLAVALYEAILRTGYPGLISRDATWIGPVSYTRRQLTALGELATNTSSSSAHVPTWFHPVLAPAGFALIAFVVLGAWKRRRLAVPDVFALSIALVLLVWLEPAARLWMPAVPMLLAYGVLAVRSLARFRVLLVASVLYGLVFAAAGTAYLGNSVRLSFSGSDFAERWPDQNPVLRATYEVAYGRATIAEVGAVNARALAVLRCYDPQAAALARSDATTPHRTQSSGRC